MLRLLAFPPYETGKKHQKDHIAQVGARWRMHATREEETDLSSQIGAFRQTISVYFYAERSRTTTSFSSTDEAQCPSVSDL